MEKMIWPGNGSFRIEIKAFAYTHCATGMILAGVLYSVLVSLNAASTVRWSKRPMCSLGLLNKGINER